MLLLDPKTLEPATEQRIILYEVSWEQYEQLSDMFVDEFPRVNCEFFLFPSLVLLRVLRDESGSFKKKPDRTLQ
jgi:hypothetical protein